MRKNKPETIKTLSVKADGSLRFILDNLAKINQLDQLVKAKLSNNVRAHCRIINYRDNQIVIATDSSAWATRVKFETPQVLSALRQEGFIGLTSIEVIVSEQPSSKRFPNRSS